MSIDVDILSRFESRPVRRADDLSLGSQHRDKYYHDDGEGSEGSDSGANANEFIYHDDFRVEDSGSEGSY